MENKSPLALSLYSEYFDQKPAPLLPLLRDFEVSVIFKFLTFSEKIRLQPINRAWLRFTFKYYAWTAFPQ